MSAENKWIWNRTKVLAEELNFSACGCTKATEVSETTIDRYNERLSKGYFAEMSYLKRNCEKRFNPTLLEGGTQSLLLFLAPFGENKYIVKSPSKEQEENKSTEIEKKREAFEKLSTTDQVDQAKKRLFAIAQDMAESLPARIPHERVPELFRVARAHYARVPSLNDLQRAWDNHMKPQAEAPAPKDAPKLAPPPELAHSEAQMRHLAAVRTAIAEGRTFELCAREDWMEPYLAADPGHSHLHDRRHHAARLDR